MKPSLNGKDKTITLIRTFFEEKYIDKVARLTGFVKRKSKLQGAIFFYMCVFSAKKEGVISVEDLSRELAFEDIMIKKQSLQDRFNDKAVNFVKRLVEESLSKKLILKKEVFKCKFERIIISDSTSFQLPASYAHRYKGFGGGASKAGIKNQYSYDLLSGEIIELKVRDGVVNDSGYPVEDLHLNDLRIEDLGYFKIERFNAIKSRGAYFLSRLKFQVSIYTIEAGIYQKLNLLKLINKMRVGEIRNLAVFIGEKEKYATRLILEKVPKALANEKRRKLTSDKQNKRKIISKERLIFCDANAFITNCTEELLPNELVRQCYSLRWQIEIVFKTWKSYFKIDKVRQMKIERFECFHYGCLMLIIVSTHLFRYFKGLYFNKEEELSELKFFKLIASVKELIKASISKNKQNLGSFLELLEPIIETTCIKEQKRNKLKPLIIMKNILT